MRGTQLPCPYPLPAPYGALPQPPPPPGVPCQYGWGGSVAVNNGVAGAPGCDPFNEGARCNSVPFHIPGGGWGNSLGWPTSGARSPVQQYGNCVILRSPGPMAMPPPYPYPYPPPGHGCSPQAPPPNPALAMATAGRRARRARMAQLRARAR